MSNTSSPVTLVTSARLTVTGYHAPKSFILRNCACCSDQSTVPPNCPACHGAGGFTQYWIADGCGIASLVVGPPPPDGG